MVISYRFSFIFLICLIVVPVAPGESRERMSLSRREKESEFIRKQRQLESQRWLEYLKNNPQSRPKPTFAPQSVALSAEEAALRMAQLVPQGSPFPLVEPKLPEGYQLHVKNAHDGLDEGVYWVGDQGFDAPYFRVSWQREARQESAERFEKESLLEEQLKIDGLTHVHVQKLKWGEYPVLAIDATEREGKEIRRAWVGMNRPDKRVLQIEFIASVADGAFVEHELLIWEPFLKETGAIEVKKEPY